MNGWINSLGGMLASGLEAGLVQFFSDLWQVILGPLEIVAGVAIVVITLAITFKDDIGTAVAVAGMAG